MTVTNFMIDAANRNVSITSHNITSSFPRDWRVHSDKHLMKTLRHNLFKVFISGL